MRKVLFLGVMLLVMAGWTVAQTTGSTPGQTGTSAQTSQTPDQAGQNPSATPSTSAQPQSSTTGAQTSETGTTERHGKLPQTASPLPLLGLLGVGSVGAGLLARKRKS